jgi:6-pyruvoyl-tetrahydropterin synthase
VYQTGIRDQFSSSHVLLGDFGPDEAERHHHDYVVEWSLDLDRLDEHGFGIDIDILVAELRRSAAALHGAHLNGLAYFKDDGEGRPRQPSVENLAEHMNRQLLATVEAHGATQGRVRETRIQLWESATAWAGHSLSVPAPDGSDASATS